MLNVSQLDIKAAGGFLSAISRKSEEYIRGLLIAKGYIPRFNGKEEYLEHILVHTEPHIDEYFAELLFRAILPANINASNLDFNEVSIYSTDNDLNCQNLFPTAAVLGLGGTVSGGAEALFIFDEHVNEEKKKRSAESCSQVIINKFIKRNGIPQSIYTILREINTIDSYGKAHPQHLGNIIKDIHKTRFFIQKGISADPSQDIRCYLAPTWKRAIIDACIASVVFCLENKIDLFYGYSNKKECLKKYLKAYAETSLHKGHSKFKECNAYYHYYQEQEEVLKEAILRDYDKILLNAAGKTIPQLFLISRICFASHNCWGENITKIIMNHLWEVIFQGQLNFYLLKSDLQEVFKKDGERFRTNIGFFERKMLPPVIGKEMLWVLSLCPNNPDYLSSAKDVLLNYVKNHNNGIGIFLIQDPFNLTKALFRCKNIPDDKWDKLVQLITNVEKDCWHTTTSPHFILNGNKAHQYRPRSSIDIEVLTGFVKKSFY